MRRSQKETEKNTETLDVLDETHKNSVPDIIFFQSLCVFLFWCVYMYAVVIFVRLKRRRKGSFLCLPAAACLTHA